MNKIRKQNSTESSRKKLLFLAGALVIFSISLQKIINLTPPQGIQIQQIKEITTEENVLFKSLHTTPEAIYTAIISEQKKQVDIIKTDHQNLKILKTANNIIPTQTTMLQMVGDKEKLYLVYINTKKQIGITTIDQNTLQIESSHLINKNIKADELAVQLFNNKLYIAFSNSNRNQTLSMFIEDLNNPKNNKNTDNLSHLKTKSLNLQVGEDTVYMAFITPQHKAKISSYKISETNTLLKTEKESITTTAEDGEIKEIHMKLNNQNLFVAFTAASKNTNWQPELGIIKINKNSQILLPFNIVKNRGTTASNIQLSVATNNTAHLLYHNNDTQSLSIETINTKKLAFISSSHFQKLKSRITNTKATTINTALVDSTLITSYTKESNKTGNKLSLAAFTIPMEQQIIATKPRTNSIIAHKEQQIKIEFLFPVPQKTIELVQIYASESGSNNCRDNESIPANTPRTSLTCIPQKQFIAGEKVTITLPKTIQDLQNRNLNQSQTLTYTVHTYLPYFSTDAGIITAGEKDPLKDALTNARTKEFDIINAYTTEQQLVIEQREKSNQYFDIGENNNSALISDINRDNQPDVITATTSNSESAITMFLQKEPKIFVRKKITLTEEAHHMSIADYNQDGINDIIVTHKSSGTISIVMLNNKTTVKETKTIEGYFDPIETIVEDLNSDGKQDLLTLQGKPENIRVHIDGYPSDYPIGKTPFDIEIADLNNDSFPDIISSSQEEGMILWRNKGNGEFIKTQQIQQIALQILVADLNADNKPEIIVREKNSIGILVLSNKFFKKTIEIPTFNAQAIEIKDINKNGNLEIFARYQNSIQTIALPTF